MSRAQKDNFGEQKLRPILASWPTDCLVFFLFFMQMRTKLICATLRGGSSAINRRYVNYTSEMCQWSVESNSCNARASSRSLQKNSEVLILNEEGKKRSLVFSPILTIVAEKWSIMTPLTQKAS